MTRTADVVVIGGGVTGASLAFHLTGLGLGRVLVLERRCLAAGGTGRSVGSIRQLYPTPEASAMVLRSLRVFQRFGDAVGGEAGYVGCGTLIGVSPAMRPKLESTLAVQRALGIRAELLEPDDVARVEPRIDPAGLGAVLYEPESGYGDPTGVTLGYADAARRRGASDRDRPPSRLRRRARSVVWRAPPRLPGSRRGELRATRDREPHADGLAHR